MVPTPLRCAEKEFGLSLSRWIALVPGGLAAAATLVVLVLRAAAEGRPATAADVVSAVAVGLIVGLASLVVPFLIARRMHPHAAGGQSHVGPARPREAPSIRFQTFDDSAKGVFTRAQDEASRLGHTYLGTEHLLLGLLGDSTSVATRALANLGVEITEARFAVEAIVGRGDVPANGELGLTPRSKRVIELGIEEARRQADAFVRSEHLLLGLLREGEGIAAGVIESFGLEPDQIRKEVGRIRDARDAT
jgi:hypothetical protein